MKKFFTFIVFTVIFFILTTGTANAVTLSPSDGTFPVSGNKTISVLSTTTSNIIQLRLTINNAKVVNYSPPGGSTMSIGVCDGQANSTRSISATKYEVCIDIVSTGSPITSGASLGTITVASLSNTGGNFTIEGGVDNGYLVNNTLEASTGVLGEYTFGTQTGNNVTILPNTALTDHMPSKGLLGVAILISGIVSLAVAIKIFLIDKRQEVF